jgi:hypothetical protein
MNSLLVKLAGDIAQLSFEKLAKGMANPTGGKSTGSTVKSPSTSAKMAPTVNDIAPKLTTANNVVKLPSALNTVQPNNQQSGMPMPTLPMF